MPVYTVVSEVADDMQVTQHEVVSPKNAICDHIASRGLDPLFEFSDDQIRELQNLAGDPTKVSLIRLNQLTNTWLWTSNSDYTDFPQPITIYVVQTDVSAN